MRSLLAVLVFSLVSLSANAAKFPAWNDFQGYSAKQMRALPDVKASAKKELNAASVKKLSIVEIVLLKNSIYAQHGFEFTSPYLKNYFTSRSWYRAGGYQYASLSKVEKKNIAFLKGMIKKAGGTDKPSKGHGADESYGYGEEEGGYGYEGGEGGYGENYGDGGESGYGEAY
ncbi:MAG: YARHG domain-containing protein [Proteobacteria bacterium]|nr:MAG: YARHG domain-containing protein [Pseudomonadota bacterium]